MRRIEHTLTKAIALVLSVCLVVSLVPATAGATENHISTSTPLEKPQNTTPEAPLPKAPEPPVSNANLAAENPTEENSGIDRVPNSAPDADNSASANTPAASEDTPSEKKKDQIQEVAEVTPSEDKALKTANENGFVYALDYEQNSATLTGWHDTAPKNEISIPQTIIVDGQTFTVQKIGVDADVDASAGGCSYSFVKTF